MLGLQWVQISISYDDCYLHQRRATQSLQGMCGWEDIKSVALPATWWSHKSLTLVSSFSGLQKSSCSSSSVHQIPNRYCLHRQLGSDYLRRYVPVGKSSHILIQLSLLNLFCFVSPQGHPWPNHSLKWEGKRKTVYLTDSNQCAGPSSFHIAPPSGAPAHAAPSPPWTQRWAQQGCRHRQDTGQ